MNALLKRGVTLPAGRVLQHRARLVLDDLGNYDASEALPERPKTRGDCVGGFRPCPWVGCRYHLMLDVRKHGAIKLHAQSPDELPNSCALDIADQGGASLEEVGRQTGQTRERIRQIEKKAFVAIGNLVRRKKMLG